MDVEVVLLIGAAVVGIVVGILHLVGYVPPRYRKMLKEVQYSTAEQVGEHVRQGVMGFAEDLGNRINASLEAQIARLMPEDGSEGPDPLIELRSGLASLQSAITQVAPQVGVEVKNALAFAQADAEKQIEAHLQTIPPEVTGALGGLTRDANRKAGDLKNAIGQGLLGPYGSLLQQFMPPLYDYLVDNPDMVVQALEMPVVQKLIQRAAGMAGQVKEAVGGWGT